MYDVLGVESTASADELRQAYMRQALRSHPDVGGDADAMTELNEAWTILSDPVRRRAYDLEIGALTVGDAPGAPGALPFDADLGDLLECRPLTPPPRWGPLPAIPPGLFAVSVAMGSVALALDSPGMLGAAVVVFLLSCVAIVAVALLMMRSSTRR